MIITTLVHLCFWCAMAMVFLKLFVPKSSKWLWVLAGAFLVSIVGDWFLRGPTSDSEFILGIAGYFFAHIGFLAYGWKFITGPRKFSWLVAAVVFTPFLIFYFVSLWPSPPFQNNIFLAAAALVYLLISCLTLTVSIDIKSGRQPSWSWFYAIGVACLAASDTLIALNAFLGQWHLNQFILPLFYTSYVFIAVSVVIQHLTEQK